MPNYADLDLTFDSSLDPADIVGESFENEDVPRLVQAWIAERFAPELRAYPEDLVHDVMEMIETQRDQGQIIEDMNQGGDPQQAFVAQLLMEEVEQLKFLMRSLLRVRLDKIEKFAQYFLSSDRERAKMSLNEQAFAQQFVALQERVYRRACLDRLPASLQRMDERSQGLSMVSMPDFTESVYFRVKRNVGNFVVDDGWVDSKAHN
ncbi:GINS complex subunit [Gonapodya sp. JEL0774]|nr:GINS complex subunit [Gonapodya sp. JEL0774]